VSTQTVQTAGLAAMPRVNLMPPEIAEAERFRRLQLAMGGAVVLSAVIVGALYQHAKSGISDAQGQLSTAQTQQTSLQSKLNSLSSVSQTYAAVHAKQQLLQEAMGGEIRWSYMLNDMSFRIPNNVWLTAIEANETTAADVSTIVPVTPTVVPGNSTDAVGTVSYSGVAFKHDDVANWLDALAKEKGFSDPSFSSSTEGLIGQRKVEDFNTSVDLTPKALSNRYVDKVGS
jgi:Tfp pilus assembly protein PilN